MIGHILQCIYIAPIEGHGISPYILPCICVFPSSHLHCFSISATLPDFYLTVFCWGTVAKETHVAWNPIGSLKYLCQEIFTTGECINSNWWCLVCMQGYHEQRRSTVWAGQDYMLAPAVYLCWLTCIQGGEGLLSVKTEISNKQSFIDYVLLVTYSDPEQTTHFLFCVTRILHRNLPI